jgi:hypothetical protein
MTKSNWLYGGIASLFLIPLGLGIPIGSLNGQQYWLIYYILSGSKLVGPVLTFWVIVLVPLVISGFCFWKLLRSLRADRKAGIVEVDFIGE